MRTITRIASTAILASATVGVASGAAFASPQNEPVSASSSSTVHGSVFEIADATDTPLVNAASLVVPLTASTVPATLVAGTVEAQPIADESAAPIDLAAAQAERFDGALASAMTEVTLATTVGSTVGGAVGMAVGCGVGAVAGGIVGAPILEAGGLTIIAGCLTGAGVFGGLGAVAGAAVVGIPAGIASAVKFNDTMNRPYGEEQA